MWVLPSNLSSPEEQYASLALEVPETHIFNWQRKKKGKKEKRKTRKRRGNTKRKTRRRNFIVWESEMNMALI